MSFLGGYSERQNLRVRGVFADSVRTLLHLQMFFLRKGLLLMRDFQLDLSVLLCSLAQQRHF